MSFKLTYQYLFLKKKKTKQNKTEKKNRLTSRPMSEVFSYKDSCSGKVFGASSI